MCDSLDTGILRMHAMNLVAWIAFEHMMKESRFFTERIKHNRFSRAKQAQAWSTCH
jgi:hypothetical protein